MLVQLLRVTIYRESGWDWRVEDIRNPTWDDIEGAIRRLDRYRYPFVWLFRAVDAAEDAVPDFTVIGGEGVFAFDCMTDGTTYRYYDPTHGDEDIDIWRSDQGAVFEEKYCCYPIDIVLRATRYFCEHGAQDPGLIWQRYPS